MAQKQLLLGDEALALGALHAGLSGVYAYPGTPSTEITEFIQSYPLAAERKVHCRWSANEKTAMESALGMSFAGKRTLVCMKHVGMNVCADPFMGSATTGANGGLVVAACDDPSMHSSQNEQDSRFWGTFALVPVFEPSSQQETYEMMRYAFDYSEKRGIPVLMRLTTRMAHSRAAVECIPDADATPQNGLRLPKNERQWCTLPVCARVRYDQLVKDYAQFEQDAVASPFNRLEDGPDKSLGIIACGIGYNYLMENFPEGCPFPVLKISQYPFPKELILKLSRMCEKILVIEEGQPMLEERMRGVFDSGVTVLGRLSGALPRT
ncbi:MAG: indolepyruvate ferredoxin oxidoreductase, partial [Bacteroidales bacterium]|nr:indolepyruvate ferredoxin oxidoreductase [Bacteroidales bacterium]